jgi:hypothetical protein
MAEEDTHSVAVHGLSPGSPGKEQHGWGLISDIDLMRAIGAEGLNSEASRAAAGVLRELEDKPRTPAAEAIRSAHEQVKCAPSAIQGPAMMPSRQAKSPLARAF